MSEDIKNEIKGLSYGAGYTVAKLAVRQWEQALRISIRRFHVGH
jgi:hypothetical protein